MSDLARAERLKYEAMYAWAPYGRPNRAIGLLEAYPGFLAGAMTAVDLGCGNGKAVRWLRDQGIQAWGVDIARNAVGMELRNAHPHWFITGTLWDFRLPAERVDLGVCSDVMEHIPEEMVSETLAHILATCRRTLFVIADYPEERGPLLLGQQLHCTIRPAEWWIEQMCSAREGASSEILARDRGQRENCHYIIAGAPDEL